METAILEITAEQARRLANVAAAQARAFDREATRFRQDRQDNEAEFAAIQRDDFKRDVDFFDKHKQTGVSLGRDDVEALAHPGEFRTWLQRFMVLAMNADELVLFWRATRFLEPAQFADNVADQ